MKTAEIMFDNKRYFYAVFMCHLFIPQGYGAPCPCL
ncbi:MAG: hypothetical protein E3K40_04960 [Candidatus Brocadia sp.]|nr:hypothetical protein [Candidatus Brocadia sp.]